MEKDKMNFTMSFTKEEYEEFERIQRKFGKSSKADLMRSALMLMKRIIETQDQGGKLILKDKKHVEREVILI